MKNEMNEIPKTTLETLARNFFKEASAYGFKQVDYVRFVNYILDKAMGMGKYELSPVVAELKINNELQKKIADKQLTTTHIIPNRPMERHVGKL